MKQIFVLIGRHIKLYSRDRSTVMFSMLSMIIVITLMVVFLGNMNVDEVVEIMKRVGVSDLKRRREDAEQLILLWTLAGVLSVNAVTISMSIIGKMVQDISTNRMQSFYVSPLNGIKLAVSYILASWIGTVVVCVMTFVLGEAFAVWSGTPWLSILEHIEILGMIAVSAFAYSAIMFFIAQFVDSMSAWSGLSTIIGTLVGFLGAIYLPIGMLPEGLQAFLKVTPFLHGAAMFRSIFTKTAVLNTFSGLPEEITAEYKNIMGISVSFGETMITPIYQVAGLLICGMILIMISAVILKKRGMTDR